MPKPAGVKNLSDELARERSRQAADRTLMAWIRTTLSLIGFGFGIANFRAILVNTGIVNNPREHANLALAFGLSFIGLGVLGLMAATLQHWNILQHLKKNDFEYTGFRPLTVRVAQSADRTTGSPGSVRVQGRSVRISKSTVRSRQRSTPSRRS